MKLGISYFYKIRYFLPNMFPLSTAVWDPKWYHNNRGKDFVYFDKRDVLNGLRFESFVPGKSCDNLCRGRDGIGTLCNGNPKECQFLQTYRNQIYSLDFDSIYKTLEESAQEAQQFFLSKIDIMFVFMFHEKPNNPCSERWTIINWFKDNGIILEEIE